MGRSSSLAKKFIKAQKVRVLSIIASRAFEDNDAELKSQLLSIFADCYLPVTFMHLPKELHSGNNAEVKMSIRNWRAYDCISRKLS